MIGFILRRLMQLLPVLLIASTGIWAMIYAVPGSPVAAMVGENATPEQVQEVTVRLGLDRPLHVQYLAWLGNALRPGSWFDRMLSGWSALALGVPTFSLGILLIQAISTPDYPLIQGCILFILVVFVLINLLVDVLYAYIDPRIDYG